MGTRRAERPGRHWHLVVLVTLVVGASMVGTVRAQSSPECGVTGQVVTESDGWTRILAPDFPGPPQRLAAYAVDPTEPDRMFASNGRAVMRSTDAGCTWQEIGTVAGTVPAGAATVIEQIVVPAAPEANDRVYLLLRETSGGDNVVRPRVVRSIDGGETWENSDQGLLAGRPVELAVAESDPDVVYLATDLALGRSLTYVSRDGGATWAPTESAESLTESDDVVGTPPVFVDIAVDPLEPEQLWAAARGQGLWRSEDGGDRWREVDLPPLENAELTEEVAVVDVFHASGSPARIWAFTRARDGSAFVGSRSLRSDDGGNTWRELPGVGPVDSVTTGEDPDDVLAGSVKDGEGWALRFMPPQQDWGVARQTDPPMRNLSSDRQSPPSFYGWADDRIWRSPRSGMTIAGPGPFRPPPPPPTPPPPRPPRLSECIPEWEEQGDVTFEPDSVSLSPEHREVALPAGESERVAYELDVPAAATATLVDLYFLIDASVSMGGALCGTANGAVTIAQRLLERGIDAHFGVGTYQHYPGWWCYASCGIVTSVPSMRSSSPRWPT